MGYTHLPKKKEVNFFFLKFSIFQFLIFNVGNYKLNVVSPATHKFTADLPNAKYSDLYSFIYKLGDPAFVEIAKNPKDSRLYEVLGDLYVKMNNFSDAKESFEAAMELSPHDEGLQKKYSQVLKKMVI